MRLPLSTITAIVAGVELLPLGFLQIVLGSLKPFERGPVTSAMLLTLAPLAGIVLPAFVMRRRWPASALAAVALGAPSAWLLLMIFVWQGRS